MCHRHQFQTVDEIVLCVFYATAASEKQISLLMEPPFVKSPAPKEVCHSTSFNQGWVQNF